MRLFSPHVAPQDNHIFYLSDLDKLSVAARRARENPQSSALGQLFARSDPTGGLEGMSYPGKSQQSVPAAERLRLSAKQQRRW